MRMVGRKHITMVEITASSGTNLKFDDFQKDCRKL